jgi:hypothetical protein
MPRVKKTAPEPATEYTAEEIVVLDMFDLMEEILQKNLGSFCFDW